MRGPPRLPRLRNTARQPQHDPLARQRRGKLSISNLHSQARNTSVAKAAPPCCALATVHRWPVKQKTHFCFGPAGVFMYKKLLTFLTGLALWLGAAPAVPAAEYPTRPVTLVVAFTPGGASDVLARLLGRKLEQILGAPFVIDNRPGAGGNVAAEAVAHTAPDGYTLLAGNNAILATNAALYKNI